MLPPWVRPESPETIRWIDDATQAFPPAFGRGTTQRGIWADPRWGLRRRYRGLRSDEKAAILNALNETRGQLNILRVTPHTPIRGSFATSELLSNNTLASGTTGLSVSTGATLSVSDRMLRTTVIANANGYTVGNSAAITVPQYAPLILRAFLRMGRGAFGSAGLRLGSSALGVQYGEYIDASSDLGMLTTTFSPMSTSAYFGFSSYETGLIAGDYFETPYLSLARGAQVDNGPNLLVRSDEFDNASWVKSAVTISANAVGAPDGLATADSFLETTATSAHVVEQAVTVTSAAADYALSFCIRANNRDWFRLAVSEDTGGTSITEYFNVTAGTIGTSGATGANWSNRRSFIQSMGNSYYRCVLIGRKTNAATSFTVQLASATADGTVSFTGVASPPAGYIWRATLAQSSVPTRLAQTTTAATTGTAQTGSALYTKGWPASTDGLLLTGDWFEINGELKQLTAPVNSDAAGLAYMQFRPSLAGSPADNDPIIVHEPFGRFIYPQGTREFENLFGIYGDCEMNLEEIYA